MKHVSKKEKTKDNILDRIEAKLVIFKKSVPKVMPDLRFLTETKLPKTDSEK